jgi:Zn-dependent protease with chaperone function
MGIASKATNWAYLPALLLAAPALLTIVVFVTTIAPRSGEDRRDRWVAYRDWDLVIQLTVLIAWWLLWDRQGPLAVLPSGGGGIRPSPQGFWYLPLGSLFFYLFVSSYFNSIAYRSRRGILSRVATVLGRLATFSLPVLLLQTGIDQLLNRNALGFFYFGAAGVAWRLGVIVILFASGMRFNALKSGETLGRVRRISHQMGVQLKYVFMVPAGRGRLINAYSLGDSIALTDSLGQHLTRDQLEYTIAHEVAHCKCKHSRNLVRGGVVAFGATAAVLFAIGSHTGPLHLPIQIVALVAPILAAEWNAKRNEYEADARAVEFTNDPEAAIRALGNLAKAAGIPKGPNWIADLFDAHPCPLYRAREIARVGHLPEERLADILREADMVKGTK